MSLLEERYYGNDSDVYDEVDELELALQEAYEAGINDGYEYALNEGVMDKLKAAKNALKNNRYRLGARALQILGTMNVIGGGAQLATTDKEEFKRKGLLRTGGGNMMAGALMHYGANKLMKKHNSPKNKLMRLINK